MTTEPLRARVRHALLRSCLGMSLGAMLFGCAAGTPRVATDLEAEVPAELRADYNAFTQNCAKCHELDRALRAHITDVRHWDLYVAKMMKTAGSAISSRESPKILRFLYWYTERKNRLGDERAKEVHVQVAEPPAAKSEPAAPAPVSAPPPAAAPSESNAVNPAPAPVNQGEGAP